MPRTTLLVAGLLGLAGCGTFPSLSGEKATAQVASHPFAGDAPKATARASLNLPKAAPEVAMRVDEVGRKLVQANPQAGLMQANRQPFFNTISSPDPEVFHVGGSMLFITEGLVRKCADDRQLAAVLALELGKMVSEREALASRQARDQRPPPPVQVPIAGNGNAASSDPTYMMELAKYENRYPKTTTPIPPPEPATVARSLLTHAGFHGSDLDAARPVLAEADRNCTLERQMKGQPGAGGWRP